MILSRDSQKVAVAKCMGLLVAVLPYDTQLGKKLIQEEAMKNSGEVRKARGTPFADHHHGGVRERVALSFETHS